MAVLRGGEAPYMGLNASREFMSSIRPWRDIERRKSRQIMVGSVPVGGDAPITVQTMTNTPTEDANATIDQIRRCEDAGADIIRVSCPTAEATAALRRSKRSRPGPVDLHVEAALRIRGGWRRPR